MKNLTDFVVIDTALELITKNGKTTNLEIKKALRNNDYFATQGKVSVMMDSLFDGNGLEFVNNGTYREYYLLGTSSMSISAVSPKISKVKAPKVPATEITVPKIGDWEVTSTDFPGTLKFYEAGSSRGVVRSAFCKSLQTTPPSFVDYLNTRAKKVK